MYEVRGRNYDLKLKIDTLKEKEIAVTPHPVFLSARFICMAQSKNTNNCKCGYSPLFSLGDALDAKELELSKTSEWRAGALRARIISLFLFGYHLLVKFHYFR